VTTTRWYEKANAYAQAWAQVFGVPPTRANVALALSVAEHETRCGNAWPGEYNWGACTKGQLSLIQRTAIRSAGVAPVLSPSAARHAAELAATAALEAAGCPPNADQAIHVDSSPAAGAYFTFFGKFADDVAGAVYFVHVIAETRASCRVVLERGGAPYELAAAMYRSHYYAGFHDPTREGGVEANVSDYAKSLMGLHPGIVTALVAWTPGAEPPPLYTEPEAPPDITTVLGVQQALNRLCKDCAPLAEDGVMGPKTHAAIATWQRAQGLTPDGIVGPKTRAALAAALERI
jgi:hypothetical protein